MARQRLTTSIHYTVVLAICFATLYLELLKLFLNHRRFPRSRKGREGKSPAEILNGAPLPHWLEQLGFERFSWAG